MAGETSIPVRLARGLAGAVALERAVTRGALALLGCPALWTPVGACWLRPRSVSGGIAGGDQRPMGVGLVFFDVSHPWCSGFSRRRDCWHVESLLLHQTHHPQQQTPTNQRQHLQPQHQHHHWLPHHNPTTTMKHAASVTRATSTTHTITPPPPQTATAYAPVHYKS